MPLNEGSGLRDMDAKDKNLELEEAEVSNSDINTEKYTESSDLFPEKESDLEYSKGETDPKHVIDSAHNAKDDACTATTGPGEANLEKNIESTTATKKGYRNAEKSDPATDENTKTVSAVSEVPPSVGHHPLGMALSRNMFKNIKGGTKSSFSDVHRQKWNITLESLTNCSVRTKKQKQQKFVAQTST